MPPFCVMPASPLARPLLRAPALVVDEFRCSARRGEAPYPEVFPGAILAYVSAGSFGCRTRGAVHELVPGAVLIGRASDEYTCTHDHLAGGDRCLSFHFAPALADELGLARAIDGAGSAPPLPALMVIGELAGGAARGESNLGLDELALVFRGRARRPQRAPLPARVRARARRDAAPVPGARAPAPRGPAARRRGPADHRGRVRCRLRRSLELRAHLPRRGRRLAARVPARLAWRPQDPPRPARARSLGCLQKEVPMFDHVGLRVRDLAASVRFYAAALEPLGVEVCARDDDGAGLGPPGAPAQWLHRASGGESPRG